MTTRATHHESWYRVESLRPRLRSVVQTYRQQYRGKTWHVIADPGSNEFFRLDEAGFYFVGLLDGKRTVDEVWRTAQETLGDAAPTQGEAVHLLGRLYVSNLIQADLPPDAAGMFSRYQKRQRKKLGGQMANLLFVRLPLIDPDRFLERWVKLFGLAFTPIGFAIWSLIMLVGGFAALSNMGELTGGSGQVLSPANLVWLSVCFWLLKLLHELGHGFACKKFGLDRGSGGEVHAMGVSLVAFMPVPYVDATSAWAFNNKWHRIVVGLGGMYFELAIAAMAAIAWSMTGGHTLVHQLAYNVMFLASVSTVLFNGNPLLRYDAYYILCDYFEVPNLAARSRNFLFYLIKTKIFGAKKLADPSHGDSERRWFVPYAIASTIYRLFVTASIILFVAGQLFFVGFIMALVALVTMFVLPAIRGINYLVANEEIGRVRYRAIGLTAAVAALVLFVGGVVPLPERGRARGVVEPRNVDVVHVAGDGFVQSTLASGTIVEPGGGPLIKADDPRLHVARKKLESQRRLAQARRRDARQLDVALVQSLQRQIKVIDQQIAQIDKRIESLQIKPSMQGTWIAPNIEWTEGSYLKRGEAIGMIATLDDLIIRITADQNLGPRIAPEIGEGGTLEMRVQGRPDIAFTGTIEKILPAGQSRLPSKALGAFAGGAVATKADDREGTAATESFFEVHVRPDLTPEQMAQLKVGQRIVARFEMPSRPLLAQGYRALRQMLQRRFRI